jgi:DNA-binding transcriptional MerR regulator
MAEAGRSLDTGTGVKGSASTSERLLTIGQLVRELQTEFPDLTISKVRYLEDRGLVSPARTKGRYRKYARGDLRRLRSVLAMQRDDYLPLEVIKKRLDRAESGSLGPGAAGSEMGARSSFRITWEKPRYALDELCEAAGVDEDFVLRLVEFRLINRTAESGPAFTDSDLDTVRVCRRLARFDLEPRHLRILGSAAEREAALIEQVATPSLRSTHADKKEYGVELVEDLASLFTRLMELLLGRELERLL